MLRWLERKLGRFAIPNLTLILAGGQVLFFIAAVGTQGRLVESMVLDTHLLLSGEWWRLLAFLFMPSTFSLLWFVFAIWLFILMGTALEREWGEFRYNLYIFTGAVVTVLTALAMHFAGLGGIATNVYLLGSVFLAFAYLYPDFQLLLFFILPVKVKWLALVTWVLYAVTMIVGPHLNRALVLAGISNFLLFFGRDIASRLYYRQRRARFQAQAARDAEEPFHRCVVCGKTDRSHPKMEFRYCNQCAGAPCYCEEHIRDHEHR